MSYLGTTINNSPTFACVLGAAITGEATGLAVEIDGATGKASVCNAAGEPAFGIIVPGHASDLAIGEEVTVQIKDIGVAKAGGNITKGAAVTVDATGKFVVAATTNYIVGYALEAAASGKLFKIQITKSGYMK